jgi:glycosyltransferase involved in cell wall biosynthesis
MEFSNISLCLVVANSEDCLQRFFKWSLPRFEDIIIVKSDSEDNTDFILDKYKDVYPSQIDLHYNKIENIAKQKQYCLDLSEKDWKLIVDADEIFEEVDFDLLTSKLEEEGLDLGYFPRYNLQVDEEHYQPEGYPDLQPRLIKSNVSFSLDPIHETHHAMVGQKKSAALNPHIIHWGHIRSEDQNLWKSNMRKRYANTDLCDGKGLRETDNWFYERNKILGLDDKAIGLPERVISYIDSFSNEKYRNHNS